MPDFRCQRNEWKGDTWFDLTWDGEVFATLRRDRAGRPGWSFRDLDSEAKGRSTRARINRLGREADLRNVLGVVRQAYGHA